MMDTPEPIQRFDASAGTPGPAVSALADDGVVHLESAFDADWLDVIEAGIADALSGGSADVDIVQRDTDAGSFSFSSGAWRSVEPFRRFIFDSHLADLVHPLLESEQLILFYDFLLIKEAHSDNASTPWHQDHSYYPLDGSAVVNSWVALDDIPTETTLRFLAGSHAERTLYRAVDFDDPDRDYRHARRELPATPRTIESGRILSSPLRRGDMLVWWSHTLHCAPGNTLDRRRAAFSVNWVGDDVVFNGAAALDTYLDPALEVGEPIDGDAFPLVRPAPAGQPNSTQG